MKTILVFAIAFAATAGQAVAQAPERSTQNSVTAIPPAADGVSRKDPALATILSFVVPGAGQFYTASPGKGTFFLVADLLATAAVVHGVACNNSSACDHETCSYNSGCTESSPGQSWITGGTAVLVVNTIAAVIDAHQAANAYNREHGLIAEIKSDRPIIAVGTRGETRLGLSIGVQ